MDETKQTKTRIIQLVLFIITIITTTLAGAEWIFGKFLFFGEPRLTSQEVWAGLYFSLPLLGILTVHELGHYFTAKYHNIKVTLPFYLPLWLGFLSIPFSIGTMGAFIRIKELIQSRKEYFDVGIAGPLAGFMVALMVLTYGFTNLPEPEYIFEIHPEYQEYGLNYEDFYQTQEVNLVVGDNLLFLFFKKYVADPERVPNRFELYHYPWLFAGYLALFFTAINLLPVGQLDGGHITYGLFGYKHSRIISRILFILMVIIPGINFIPAGPLNYDFVLNSVLYLLFLFLVFHHFEKNIKKRALLVIWIMIVQVLVAKLFPEAAKYGNGVYLVFAFIFGRFLGIDHPKAVDDRPLDLKRKILGWIALVVFIISFTPRLLYFEINEKTQVEKPGLEQVNLKPSKIVTRRMIEIF